jgi:hypothetical protein
MRHLLYALLVAGLTAFTGCASFGPDPLTVGESEAQVVAKLGPPAHRYQDGNGRLLEYSGRYGQETYMARIGPDDRLISYEQVLTDQKFGTIKPDQASKNDVLRIVGAPSATSYLALPDLEVWSYPYKQSGVWNSVMHIHFDRSGTVRKLVSTQDWRFVPRDGAFGMFGFGRM